LVVHHDPVVDRLDLPSGLREQWQPLVSISGDDAEFSAKYPVATRDNVIKFLAFASENPNSIVSCLRAARENARTIRESISPRCGNRSTAAI
jgi:uncharacterized alpha-E superfamily protein